MMKYLKLTACFLLFPLVMSGKANMDSIRLSLKYLEDGLRSKEIPMVQRSLAPDFSISTYMWPSAGSLLKTILDGMAFESISPDWKQVSTKENVTCVQVRFILANEKKEDSVIAFNSSGKILFIDYFDRLFGDCRYRKSSLVATLPFRLENGSIILSARLNDSPRILSFLLDTGADGMAIRKSLADSIGLKTGNSQKANIVGGQAMVQISSGNILHLSDSLSIPRQNIAIFEKVRNMDGIIGLNLLKRYITKVDFDTQTLSLYSFGTHDFQEKGVGKGYMIPVSTPQNLIILPSELNLTGDKSIAGNFIMDTGANYFLIAFSPFVRSNRLLLSGFQPEGSGSTVSLGHVTPVFYGRARSLKVGGLTRKNIPVTLQASTGNSTLANDGVDGSIGIQFFSEFNFTVDLLRKVVYLSPRKKVASSALHKDKK